MPISGNGEEKRRRAKMDKEKQIEEMAKAVCHLDRTCDQCMTSFECKAMTYAKRFYDNGYRKSSDVAREIFADLEKIIEVDNEGKASFDIREFHHKIEKKYTEGGDTNVPTNENQER
jgi:hypothetical protein